MNSTNKTESSHNNSSLGTNLESKLFTPIYFCLGIIMGIADSVPGISSSTVLLISNKYEYLISIFAHLFSKQFIVSCKDFILSYSFISITKSKKFIYDFHLNVSFSLFVGIMLGFTVSFFTFAYFLEEYTTPTLQVVSVLMIFLCTYYFYEHKELFLLTKYTQYYSIFVIVFIIFYVGFNHVSEVTPTLPVIFISGFWGTIIMLLPGISGSLFLVLSGMYIPIKNALVEFDWAFLGVFTCGSIAGLLIGLKVIDYLNEHFNIRMKFALLGILISATSFLVTEYLIVL